MLTKTTLSNMLHLGTRTTSGACFPGKPLDKEGQLSKTSIKLKCLGMVSHRKELVLRVKLVAEQSVNVITWTTYKEEFSIQTGRDGKAGRHRRRRKRLTRRSAPVVFSMLQLWGLFNLGKTASPRLANSRKLARGETLLWVCLWHLNRSRTYTPNHLLSPSGTHQVSVHSSLPYLAT